MKRLTSTFLLMLTLLVFAPLANADRWSSYNIMIDPGHGGSDPGAQGPSWPHEAELALRCSNAIRERLENVGCAVQQTRYNDVFVDLSVRRQASINYDPWIFCSVHLNAFDGNAHGTETWYYWSAGNSYALATRVQAQLINYMGRVNRGVKQNGWTVITGSSNIPAILTEGLFVDNWEEWNLINDNSKDGFKRWVNGHLAGFRDHMRTFTGNLDDPTVDDSKDIYISTDNVGLNCNIWEHPTWDITVSSKNITEDISIWVDDASIFSIDRGSLGAGGGSFRVTFEASNWYHYKETWAHVRANGVQKDIKLSCDVKGDFLPELGEVWNLSAQRGSNWNKGYDATQIRNFCYLNGKLYCVYQHSKIIVLNAQTGDYLGELKGDGIGEGTLPLCDVKAISGKIVACNLAVAGQSNLRIYKWDNDNATPNVILNTWDFQGVDRIGDCMEVVGTLDVDAWFAFMREMTDDTRIVEYHQVSEYNFEPKYTLALDANGNKLHVGATPRAYPWGGPFWVDGNAIVPTFLCWNGYAGVSPSATCPTNGQTQGASHHEFYYHGWKYAANLVFRGDANYTSAKLRVERDKVGNFSDCDEVREYPWDGLGTAQNSGGTGEVIINTNEHDFCEGWVLSTTQGLAYFRSGNVPGHDVQPVNKPALWFSERDVEMRGKVGETTQRTIRIEGENIRGNIYLTAHDAHDGRSTNALQIWPTELSGPGEVTVSYKADDYDSNWIWIQAVSDGADDAYIDIQAENYRDPAIYVDGDPNFSCFADQPQTHEFRVYGRDIKGWAGAGLWGNNSDHNNQFELWHSWGLKENTTVYFNNNRSHWDRVYVWIWNKDNPYYNYLGVDYPGIQLWDRGDGYCEFTFRPEDLGQNLGIMFNDGYENDKERQKTDDGYVLDHAVYYTGGNSAWWRIPGRRQPLHCDFDGSLYVKYRPYSVGQHNSNFFVATDNKWPNYDVALNGFCNGMSALTDIDGNPVNDVTVINGVLTVSNTQVNNIYIYNAAGAVVAHAANQNSLSVANLPTSAYIVAIDSDSNEAPRRLKLKL